MLDIAFYLCVSVIADISLAKYTNRIATIEYWCTDTKVLFGGIVLSTQAFHLIPTMRPFPLLVHLYRNPLVRLREKN